MKLIYSFFMAVAIGLSPSHCFAQPKNLSEKEIAELVKKMTLEEKVGQMAQVTLDVLGKKSTAGSFELDGEKVKDAIVNYKLGSVLNTSDNKAMSLQEWNTIVGALQKETKKTKLGIPLIYGFDAIHGATYVSGATFFPQPLGQAATWNRDLVRQAASITAYESRAASVPWNFSPVLDLGMNPLWARIWETYGEDPFLVAELGKQVVAGYQGNFGGKENVAACLKHYLAYSDPKTGKDRTNTWLPENYLREYHLPSFKAAIDAGAASVMVNSGLINGLPTHINKYLLTDVLKNELGFSGVVVTDWQDIENVYKRDKIAASYKEAIMMSINAGIDMAMIPYDYETFCKELVSLVREQKVSINRIDDAVVRILKLKSKLGIFENPVTDFSSYPDFGSSEFTKAAYDCAVESITLLKNSNGILPIKAGSKVLVTGPNAHSMRALNGGWSYSWQGEKTEQFTSDYNTILTALQKKLGKENVSYFGGVNYVMSGKYFEDTTQHLEDLSKYAASADYIILCLGENSYTEKPGDLNDLSLSSHQLELAKAAIRTGKPVILVLNEGRPRVISDIELDMSAIIQTYLPGNYGADALCDILLGKINPSGKLPITYPRYVNSLTTYIHKPSDQQTNPQGAYDYSADYNPQYDFGYGLSYTSFSYSELTTDKKEYTADEMIKVSVRVKNTGKTSGKEVVQLYISDLIASLTPDVKRLRGFEKIMLEPGEEKRIDFTVPFKNLSFVDANNKNRLEEGAFNISIGGLSASIKLR